MELDPNHEALAGPATAGLGVLDMANCALFVYLGKDGTATSQADGITYAEAARALRHLANHYERKTEQ